MGLSINNNRYKKNFYKQFLRLRKNVQDRPKFFKFKRKKWVTTQRFLLRDLKFFRRYRIKDQFRFFVRRFRSRGNSFQQKFRQNLYDRKTFTLFYGGLKKKYLKKSIQYIKSSYRIKNSNYNILKIFESRLDTVLYRSGFCYSIQNARQFILHGGVLVNGKTVSSKSYLISSNDLIEVCNKPKMRKIIKSNLLRSNFWPIPPKHMVINYKTLQIIYVFPDKNIYSPIFNHYLNVESLSNNIREF